MGPISFADWGISFLLYLRPYVKRLVIPKKMQMTFEQLMPEQISTLIPFYPQLSETGTAFPKN